jgi:hypothetical protein
VTLTYDRPAEEPALSRRRTVGQQPKRAAKRRSRLRRIVSEGGIVFFLALAAYLIVAILLDFHYDTFNGDAVSRMANGFYVLYSRDPHLAAVGFVWNPGTSIADSIPLLFYHLWTPLASHMFAASLVSAFCMAGAVYQVRSTLAEWGVARAPRLVLVAILATNGMVLYYGGNGMSEGLYLFTLVATARYLLRWLRDDDLTSLVYSATALGLCYLARNEAALPAVFAGLTIIVVGYLRRSTSQRERIWGALTDATIFEIPFVAAFGGWALVSYVITGQPFQQFTSVYGTTSQIQVAGSVALKFRILQDVHDLSYLAPILPVILVLAIVVAVIRRDIGIAAPIVVIGGGLAFDALAYVNNSIQPWFRYFLTAVPLEVLLVGSLFATAPALIRLVPVNTVVTRRTRRPALAALYVLVALAFLIPSSVTTLKGMGNPKIGYEETQHLAYIFSPHPSKFDEEAKTTFPAVLTLADYFSSHHFANGQVIVDNFSGCIPNVILASPNPDVFVIPNDRDFQKTLADPLTFHTHYILDVNPSGDGALTAPNTTFPNLWKTGDGFTKVVHTFRAVGECPEFKLLKVTGHPNQIG